MTMRILAAFAGALLLVACGPDIKGLQEGERAKVAAVYDGDTLALDSNLRVTLTGIEAPYGDAPYAREARTLLSDLALNRPARLGYGGLRRLPPRRPPATSDAATPATPAATSTETPPREPQRETALAHVFVQSEGGRWIWLQQAMVARGAAFARPRKDNPERGAELLAAEAQARAAHLGLWAQPAYRVRTSAQIEREADNFAGASCGRGDFRLVEGVVRGVSAEPTRVYLNFGDDYQHDFTIAIYGDAVSGWDGPPFASYEGKSVRVHGPIINRGGPLACVDTARQIEILETP